MTPPVEGRPPIVVIGVGSSMRGDDGVGPAVLERLDAPLADRVDVEALTLDGEATRLVEAIDGRSLAVIVDAIRTGASPGTVHRHDALDGSATPLPGASASTHLGGVAEAVALARALDRLPSRLVVVGVEPATFELGAALSDAVEASLGYLVDAVLDLIDR